MLNTCWRRSLVLLAGAIVIVAAGCSGGVAPQDADAPIAVTNTSMMVSVENRAGLALNNINVAIDPMGGATEFTSFVGRLENGTSRDIMLGSFGGRDGTPFNLRVIRPKAIRVTAEDINGESYEVIAPWN